jgi:hypothetical protein
MPKIIGALRDLALEKYKKEFDPETYYHISRSPDIEQFIPTASPARSVFSDPNQPKKPLGAAYFTKSKHFLDQIYNEMSGEWEDEVRKRIQSLKYKADANEKRHRLQNLLSEYTKRRSDARYIENDLVDMEDPVYGKDMINHIKKVYGSREKAIELITENERKAAASAAKIEKLSGLPMPTGTSVYPVKIKTKDLFDPTDEYALDDFGIALDRFDIDKIMKKVGEVKGIEHPQNIEAILSEWRVLEIPEIQEVLKDMGYRGYFTDEPGTAALFHPEKGDVRSVFAKFNPEDKKSGNISASIVGSVGVGGALGGINGQSSD